MKPCPKCGKPMAEEPAFPGLWMCPDGKVRLNDGPPFRFACDGMELTRKGCEALDAELTKQWMKDRLRKGGLN